MCVSTINRKNVSRRVTGVLFVLLLASASNAQIPLWPSFGGDDNSGRLPFFVHIGRQPVADWEVDVGGAVCSSIVLAADGKLIMGAGKSITAVTPDGVIDWTYPTNATICGAPAVTQNGYVYIADQDGWLYCLQTDGSFEWAKQPSPLAETRISGALTVDDEGNVYAGNWEGHLFKYNTAGVLQRDTDLGVSCIYSPVGISGNEVFVTATDGAKLRITAVHRQTGAKRTRTFSAFKAPTMAGPVLDATNNTIYLSYTTEDGAYVAARRMSNFGVSRWTSAQLPWGIHATPAIGINGEVLVPCLDGKLYALNPANGRILWSYDTDTEGIFCSPSVDRAGWIFFGTIDGNLRCLLPDGSEYFTYSMKGHLTASPVSGGDGFLYVATQAGIVQKLVMLEAFARQWGLYR